MTSDFAGVAVVTGAGGTGIGNAVALAFVRAGCNKIAITDCDIGTLKKTYDEIQAINPDIDILATVADVSKPEDVDRFFDEVSLQFGRVDYAVNNAGILGSVNTTSEMSIEDFEKVNGVNYKGVWYCCKKELAIMKEQEFITTGPRRQRGSIVNIASQLALVGRKSAPVYCASKSAVVGLTRCDAIDHANFGIRVNAVCPGIIATPMTLRPGATSPTDVKDYIKEEIETSLMGRMGLPEEIADVVIFLSSEKASFVQGAAWVADGGYIIQ